MIILVQKIKEEIDKLLEAEFIYEIEHTDWVSPIVISPKKEWKITSVCQFKASEHNYV